MMGAGWAWTTPAYARVTSSEGTTRSKVLEIRDPDFMDIDPLSVTESAPLSFEPQRA
jgi:hypothetical protein